jgi:putative transcriptional regulator
VWFEPSSCELHGNFDLGIELGISANGWISAYQRCLYWIFHGGNLVGGKISYPPEIRMKNNLRVLRAERQWSQAKLGELLKVSRQTINAIENGKYDPSLPLAFKMAHLFEMPLEEIFVPTEDDLK